MPPYLFFWAIQVFFMALHKLDSTFFPYYNIPNQLDFSIDKSFKGTQPMEFWQVEVLLSKTAHPLLVEYFCIALYSSQHQAQSSHETNKFLLKTPIYIFIHFLALQCPFANTSQACQTWDCNAITNQLTNSLWIFIISSIFFCPYHLIT
jgi:hypothetical protein